MSSQLVYVVGPSGAGKDSVLACLREQWPAALPTYWARRTITRAASATGEQHEPVDETTFHQLLGQQAFAMHWHANGLAYGLRKQELAPLACAHTVFVNGSRAYLPELLRTWPQATVVHIGASPAVLEKRLLARGRETPEAVAARLQRAVEQALPEGGIRIQNDGRLEDAAQELLQQLRARVAADRRAEMEG